MSKENSFDKLSKKFFGKTWEEHEKDIEQFVKTHDFEADRVRWKKEAEERLQYLKENNREVCQEIKNQTITYIGSICSNCKKPFETDTGQGETICIHCYAEYNSTEFINP